MNEQASKTLYKVQQAVGLKEIACDLMRMLLSTAWNSLTQPGKSLFKLLAMLA